MATKFDEIKGSFKNRTSTIIVLKSKAESIQCIIIINYVSIYCQHCIINFVMFKKITVAYIDILYVYVYVYSV